MTRPPSASPPGTRKSDRTRAAILAAARQAFAECGYERAGIRDIASQAGVDPALVIRYFGSKEELFAVSADFDLRLPDVENIDPAALGAYLVRHFLALWEGPDRHDGLAVLLRSAASNEFAAQRMREIFSGQVLPALARGRPTREMKMRAGLIASQMLGLAICRYVLKIPPVVDMTVSQIAGPVGRTIQSYLRDPL